MIIRNAKGVQAKANGHQVRKVADGVYEVISGTSGRVYRVELVEGMNGATCTCDWGQWRPIRDRRSACSHVLAVHRYLAQNEGYRVSAWSSPQDAARQHRISRHIGDGVVLTYRRAA